MKSNLESCTGRDEGDPANPWESRRDKANIAEFPLEENIAGSP